MKRPLAVFGLGLLAAMLLAVQLPSAALYIAAACFVAVFVLCVVLRTKLPLWTLVLVGAVLVALGWRIGYDALRLAPIQQLSDSSAQCTLRVTSLDPGYGEGNVHATAEVLLINGENPQNSFLVQLQGIEPVPLGQIITTNLEFEAYDSTSYQSSRFSQGYYIHAEVQGPLTLGDISHTVLTRVRAVQYAASANILSRLPQNLSSVAAAISTGDTRFLTAETKDAYRSASLSHVLVVSGLHLSMLCGVVNSTLVLLLRRRRLAAVGSIIFALFFMAFTGFTPSVVRSGIMWLLIYAAALIYRKADTLTSLGAAAIALVLTNPYAAADIGLLLSFSATLGAMAGGSASRRVRMRHMNGLQKRRMPHKIATFLMDTAMVSACVTLATLPVLIYAEMGISLLSIPANMLAVPLLAPIVVCGLLMALPLAPLWNILATPAAVICGALVQLLEWFTQLCSGIPKAWVPVGGEFALVVVLLLCGLGALALGAKRRLAYVLVAVFILQLAVALHISLNANTVRIYVAGGGPNSSMVVISEGKAVVLYRGRNSEFAIQNILRQNRIEQPELLIDLRRSATEDEDHSLLAPQELVIANTDIILGEAYPQTDQLTVYVAKQDSGSIACVDIMGYRLGLCSGDINLEPYGSLNVLLAGSGEVQGQYNTLLYDGRLPQWGAPTSESLFINGDALIWVRPGTSVLFKEVNDGIGNE